MRNVEKVQLTTTKPQTIWEEMLKANRDRLSALASSEDEEDGEDEDDHKEDAELGKLSENDQHGWVLGTIFKRVQHHVESFRHKQMRLDELTQPGWAEVADYFPE